MSEEDASRRLPMATALFGDQLFVRVVRETALIGAGLSIRNREAQGTMMAAKVICIWFLALAPAEITASAVRLSALKAKADADGTADSQFAYGTSNTRVRHTTTLNTTH